MELVKLPGVKKYTKNKTTGLDDINIHLVLMILFVAGFVFRVLLLHYRFAVTFDEVNYLKLGVSAYKNGFSSALHTYWSPLLPVLIAVTCKLFSNYELAARFVSIFAGSLLIFPVYWLGKYVYNKKVSLVAAFFVAFYPPLVFQSTQILTEPVYMLLATTVMFCGLKMLYEYSVAYAFFSGLISGLLYLIHPLGFGFTLLLIFWIITGTLFKLFLINKFRLIYMILSFLFGFLVIASPYLFYLKNVTGTWTLSAKASANQQMEAHVPGGVDLFRSLDEQNKHVVIDQIYHQGDFIQATHAGKRPVEHVALKPLLVKYIENVSKMFSQAIPQFLTLIPLMLLSLGLLGHTWLNKQGIKILYLLSCIVFYWLIVIPLFHINLRYLSPLLPLCSIWIAGGAYHVYDWLSDYLPLAKFSYKHRVAPNRIAMMIILITFLGGSFLPELGKVLHLNPTSDDYYADPVGQKRAGLWLKKHADKSPVIMSRNHAVDIYAGNYNIKESVTVPVNKINRIIEYAKNRGVNYLVLNERYERDYEQIAFLLEGKNIPAGLQLIYREKDPSGLITVIYEFLS